MSMMHPKYRKSIRVVSVVVWKEADIKVVPKVDMGAVVAEDMEEEEVYPPHV
jgi:hypothetical protein